MDIKKVLSEMTIEEKAGLCSGKDFWRFKSVERLGVPEVMVSDGPHGLRKQAEGGDHLGINDSIEATCFPTSAGLAASFDREIAAEQGDAWASGQLKQEWPEMQSSHTYFTQAKEYGDSVFLENVFDLESDFRTLFGGERLSFSKEFVFVIDATMNTTENVGYNSLHWTFSPQNSSVGESWGRTQPSKAFYNWARGTYQGDPRLDYTFISKWYKYINGAESDELQTAYPLVSKQVNDTTWVDSVVRPGRPPIKVPVVTTTRQIVDSINYTIPSTNAPGDYSNEQFADVRNRHTSANI